MPSPRSGLVLLLAVLGTSAIAGCHGFDSPSQDAAAPPAAGDTGPVERTGPEEETPGEPMPVDAIPQPQDGADPASSDGRDAAERGTRPGDSCVTNLLGIHVCL